MTLLNQQIKMIILFLIVGFSFNAYSQKETKSKKTFVRVYNFEGKKINKGYIVFVNDSILGLENNSKLVEVTLREIGFIKTKRSAGNNILIGAASGTALGAVIGVSTADPDALIFGYTAGEGAVVFGGIGALGGSAIGGITALFKKTETYSIDGDFNKWQAFINLIEGKVTK